MKNKSAAQSGVRGTQAFRLYVAGTSPNSVRAIENFDAIRREFLPDGCQLEVIDVLEDPLHALDDGVLVTPTLMRLSPAPARIVGNLSDRSTVLLTFGLKKYD